jgi:hypothetical protein
VRVALFALLLGACSFQVGNGQLTCRDNGGRCPRGFHCAADQTCWHDGDDPGLDGFTADAMPLKAIGEGCDDSVECASQICTGPGGVCCNHACDGTCETCTAPDMAGQCTRVTGQPTGGKKCLGDTSGDCVGTCSGSSAECDYPSTSKICGANCDSMCDGKGHCPSGGTDSCPDGFSCGPNACLTVCNTDADCQPHFTCDTTTHKCKREDEVDCFDSIDNNGDGAADCYDPTCKPSRAACVPETPLTANGVFGVVSNGFCPAGFQKGMAPLHQGIVGPPCSGCTCETNGECSYTAQFYKSADCLSSPYLPLTVRIHYPPVCSAVLPNELSVPAMTTSVMLDRDSETLGCVATGGAAPPAPPTWSRNAVFCGLGAKSGMGCNVGEVCVPINTCQRNGGAGACSGAFPNPDPSGTYYSTFSDTRSCSCGACAPASGDHCPDQVAALDLYDASCTPAASSGHIASTPVASCVNWGGSNDWGGTIALTNTMTPSKIPGTNCQIPTNQTGTVTAGTPSTICCQ